MDDLISRAAALDAIDFERKALIEQDRLGAEHVVVHHARRLIEELPAVDAAPVVHGWWIHLDPRERATISGKCSCCGWEAHYYEDDVADMPYCPNCGARMDGETNG